MKEKIKKEYLRRTRKLLEKNYRAETYQSNEYLGCLPRKIFGTILEMNQRRLQTI